MDKYFGNNCCDDHCDEPYTEAWYACIDATDGGDEDDGQHPGGWDYLANDTVYDIIGAGIPDSVWNGDAGPYDY